MLGQIDDVFPAVAQRRQMHDVKAEAVQKICAKPLSGDLRPQVGVCGTDHPHIHLQGLLSADALELAILNEAQQLLL